MDFNEKMYEYGKNGSAMRELYEIGLKLKKELGKDKVFDFSIGNPSAKVPEQFNNTIKVLLDFPGIHAYTSGYGLEATRDAIAKYTSKTYNANIDKNLIYITCGAAASLTICFNTIIDNPDDEIILFAPYFPEYNVFITKAGGKSVIVDPDLDNFEINFEDLSHKISPNTKAVVIDFPNNPTGAMISKENLIKLTSFLKQKENEYGHVIYLISDEPYREIIYGDEKYNFVTNFYDDSIVTYSYSKALSLPGERIGYILLSPKLKNANLFYKAICGAGRALGFVCAPSIFQRAIALNQGLFCDFNEYKENRDLLVNMLDKLGYTYIKPQGAFYLFVKALEDDDRAFSKHALQYNLLLPPSTSFGIKGYVRISYCVDKSTIINSFDAFKKLKDDYK